MPLCTDCQALTPYKLLARPVHNPHGDGIDPLFFTLKPDFHTLEESAAQCALCNLILDDLHMHYSLEELRAGDKAGQPTPIQLAANVTTGEIETPDSMREVARHSTLWVCCGSFDAAEDSETDPKPSLLLASRSGKYYIYRIVCD